MWSDGLFLSSTEENLGSMFRLQNSQKDWLPRYLPSHTFSASFTGSFPSTFSKAPLPVPCSPLIISVVLWAPKQITPKSMLLAVIFLPGSRAYFTYSWYLSENVTPRSQIYPWENEPHCLINTLGMSGEPNVTARLLSYSTCLNSTHHLPAQATPPSPQPAADPTPSPLRGLKPLSSSPPFLQILKSLPSSTGFKSVFYFACCQCPSSSPYHLSPASLVLPLPSSPVPTLHTADRHLPKTQISTLHSLALPLTPFLRPGWICRLLSENDLLPCSS